MLIPFYSTCRVLGEGIFLLLDHRFLPSYCQSYCK